MKYTFDLVGITPILDFFTHQQQHDHQHKLAVGVEYIGTQTCTLDAVIASVESISACRSWHLDQVIDTVVQFWLHNAETIQYWKTRLTDAGSDNILVARVADIYGLQAEFESLLRDVN